MKWFTPLILVSGLIAYLTANRSNPPSYFVLAGLLSMLPLWPVIAYYSNNTLRDALIYDVIITLTYAGVIALCSDKSYTLMQVCGCFVAVSGILLVKIGGTS